MKSGMGAHKQSLTPDLEHSLMLLEVIAFFLCVLWSVVTWNSEGQYSQEPGNEGGPLVAERVTMKLDGWDLAEETSSSRLYC